MLKFEFEIKEDKKEKRDREFIEQDMYYTLMRLREIRDREDELREIIKDKEQLESDLIKFGREFWEAI